MTAGETAVVPFPLKWSVNAAPPAGCTARRYAPEPDLSVPVRFTASPAENVGTSGYTRGKTWAF